MKTEKMPTWCPSGFSRVLNPGTVEEYSHGERRRFPVFVKVEYRDGQLSMTGVVGPRANGDAWGSCGQIVDTLAREDFQPTPGAGAFWAMNAKKLRATWERWHLNDMRPCCEHQRALGWYEKAGEKVKLYHWRLDDAAQKEKTAAEKAAQAALLAGEVFTPSKRQHEAARREYELTTHTPEAPKHYGPRGPLWAGHSSVPVEEKGLGCLYEKEHPEGLLCRPCPECGYKYGSEWRREDVPEAVLRFLYECPEAETKPAWC